MMPRGSWISWGNAMRAGMALSLAVTLLCATAVRAEVAIIPYKINNPSADFPESTGGEYSRLVALSSIIAKENIEITSPRDVDLDLERMKVSPGDVITREDLDLLGRTRRIDYFVLGSLSRIKGRYHSESVLYSVRDGKVIARARADAEDLFTLADRETGEALVHFKNKEQPRGSAGGGMDLLFLIDLSYRMNQDWNAVKEGILGLSSSLVDTRRLDTRVYLVPFSDRTTHPSGTVAVNSISAVREALDALKPAGGAGPDSFNGSLRYSITTTRWRPDAAKMMIIISNSGIASRTAEEYGARARKKGITIHTLSLGRVPGEQSEVLGRLAEIGGGTHAHATYHQKLFAADGEPVEVYMENGRFFRSRFPDAVWKKGLYRSDGPRSYYGKPKSFIEEIIYNEKKDAATPYAMDDAYTRNTMERIINRDPLESNVDLLLDRMAKKIRGRASVKSAAAGRALISDGAVSFWVTAPAPEYIDYFISAQRDGAVVALGVTVRKDASSPYGIALVPVVRGLPPDYVPGSATVRLGDLVKRGDYYSTHGLSRPPVWFVRVTVDRAEKFRRGEDVRGK